MIFKERIYLYAARSTPLGRWITTGMVITVIVVLWWWLAYSSWYRKYSTAAQEYCAAEQVMKRIKPREEVPSSHQRCDSENLDLLLQAALQAGLSINTCSGEQQGSERTVTLMVQGSFDSMVSYLAESSHISGWWYQQGDWTVLPYDEMRAVITGLCEVHDHT